MSFRIVESATREEWLENRRQCLTGTDIAALMTGGAAAWEKVRASKLGPVDTESFDNKYMAWGREREPAICETVSVWGDTRLKPNDQFIINDELGFGCTPDMLGDLEPTEDGGLITDVAGEIKTSKYPMPVLHRDRQYFGYRVQTQVELMVTGADMLVLAWEQHDDNWPRPQTFDVEFQTVYPDEELQARILETVARFKAGGQPSVDMRDLVKQLGTVTRELEVLKARETALKDAIKAELKEGDRLTVDGVGITYSAASSRSRFDSKAFGKAHPELLDEFTTTTKVQPMLRITWPKEG